MKRYFVLLSAIGFLSLTLLGGCTKEAELQAANRRMAEQLENANQTLGEVRKANQALERDLAAANQTIKNKDAEIGVLNDALAKLKADYDELARKYAALGGQKPQPLNPVAYRPLPPGLTKALMEWAAKHGKKFKFYPELGMVKFEDDDTFTPGSDDVKADVKKIMAELAGILNEPDALPFDIYLAGHADDMPIVSKETRARHPNNWYLSVHRAVAIEDIFEKAGVKGSRIGAVGFSDFHPVAPNKPGHKGNSKNRRVELWIVSPDKFVVPPAETGTESPTETPEPTVPPTTPVPAEKPVD
jgi:chemotaxis protein MotB